jgi:tRNA threonylcarbamoyladenosine biosynthesis protein TsaE
VPTFRTASEEETIALGERLASQLPRRAAVLLIGNLGAGKTTLAKGIAKGLGAADPDQVSSPTFTLIHEYGQQHKVYHVDLYRLDRVGEVAGLGLEELFEQDSVVLVEWGERFPQIMPAERIEIRIETGQGDQREITVTPITT